METKYLDLYYQWMEDGKLPGDSGLCKAFEKAGLNYHLLNKEFLASAWINYNLYDKDRRALDVLWDTSIRGDFNGVRQNIVLLLAAMNGEFD